MNRDLYEEFDAFKTKIQNISSEDFFYKEALDPIKKNIAIFDAQKDTMEDQDARALLIQLNTLYDEFNKYAALLGSALAGAGPSDLESTATFDSTTVDTRLQPAQDEKDPYATDTNEECQAMIRGSEIKRTRGPYKYPPLPEKEEKVHPQASKRKRAEAETSAALQKHGKFAVKSLNEARISGFKKVSSKINEIDKSTITTTRLSQLSSIQQHINYYTKNNYAKWNELSDGNQQRFMNRMMSFLDIYSQAPDIKKSTP